MSSYLRDTFDALASKKLKDLNDFEWQKCFRVYLQDEHGLFVPHLSLCYGISCFLDVFVAVFCQVWRPF